MISICISGMDIKQCSKCKCNKPLLCFEKNDNEYFKTCINCRNTRQRHYEKHKADINRKRREERACNGNMKCECGLIVKPEKWEEHLNWMWHWSGLKNKVLNEYKNKMLVAKKKDHKILKKEKDEKLKEFMDKSGREFIL